MFKLEKSIANWLKSFRKHPAYDEASYLEMELHLRDHIEDLIHKGYTEQEAFEKAVAEFGDVPAVAKEEYSTQTRNRTMGRILYSTLFKNYYKTSLRSMMRNPLSSFINVVGLAAAIGICIFTYSFAQWTYRTDQFHEHKNEVFLTTFFANREGKIQQNGRSPVPLAKRLQEDFPQIDDVCRVQNTHAVVKYNDHIFHERITFADPSYLSLFTFPLRSGAKASLEDKNSVILSDRLAKKYFGEKDPIGQNILIKFSDASSKTFKVTGVAEDFPPSISFNFNFLIHFENIEFGDAAYDKNDWSAFVDATFIHMSDTTGLNQIAKQMDEYRILQNESKKDWQVESFAFEPLATLHKRSADIRNAINISLEDGYASIIYLTFVGIFMLVLACFNYINISIVSAAKRLKEIGIRKTIGANRKIIIIQFLSENLVATSLALGLGVILGVYVFIPWFESLFYFDMGFKWMDLTLWIYLPLVLLFTALASGLYPAFYISKFPVTGILKGSVKFGKKNPLTRFILGFQLILSCMFVTCAIMFTQNAQYLANRSWGYNEDQALYVEVPDASGFRQLSASLEQETDVITIAGSSHHLGKSSLSTIVKLPTQDHEVEQIAVDANYFAALGIDIVQGRGFQDHSEADRNVIVVNEQFVKKILGGKPIDALVKIDSARFTVAGVVKDFHNHSFETEVAPTFFRLADPSEYRYLSIKVKDGTQNSMYQSLQKHWITHFPETPFQGGYQEDVWGMYFVEIGIHGKVWRGIAMIAILLAGLGLYGLVTLNVTGRIREFSIRKVLGANIRSLARNITKQYIMLFVISLGIGSVLSYYLISFIFDSAYTYHMPVGIGGVSLAVVTLVSVLLLVVSVQLSRVSKANPVEGLQME